MKPRNKAPGVESELDQLREIEQQLKRLEVRNKRFFAHMAEQRVDQSRMLPPMKAIQDRQRRKHLEQQLATRGELANIRRDQARSLAGFFLLSILAAVLVCWGISLMRGIS
jgi:hypothetical protein